MELQPDIKRRLYALHPDMRFRIEDKMNYDANFNPEKEILCSEKAMELFQDLRGEGEIFFWTLKGVESKREVEGMESLSELELDQVGVLALSYVRNPLSVKDVKFLRLPVDQPPLDMVD